jgi:exodeoxyribonuclease VII small subunit
VSDSRPADELGYAEALAELEAIVRELEASAVDVDILTDKVARARVLVARCRERIDAARLHVEQVTGEQDMGEHGMAEQGSDGPPPS